MLAKRIEPFDGGVRRRCALHALAGVRAAAQPRRARALIACDVIEALVGGALARERARASPASTSPRSSATARGSAAIEPARCARSSRRTPTVTAPSSARARRSPAARRGSRSRPPPRPPSCAHAGIDAPILVMGALDPRGARARARRRRRRRRVDRGVRRLAARRAAAPRVHVKLDTGMGRLGTRDGALADAARRARRARRPELELAGAMTHFATADEADRSFLRDQLERFASWVAPLRERHPQLLVHAENSAALLGAGRARFDMVRCGGAIYGLDPLGVDPARAAGSSRRSSCARRSRRASRARPARAPGYGRRVRRARGDASWRSIPIGYGDGVRRVLSNNSDVLIGGRRRPLVGTVSMDNLTVDLGRGSGVAVGAPRRSCSAPTASERISAEEIAARAGHDQLRDHLRDQPARAARLPPRRRHDRAARARSSSRARCCGGEPLLARRRRGARRAARARRRAPTSTSWSTATSRRPRVRWRAPRRRARVPALGRVRRVARRRARSRAGRSTSPAARRRRSRPTCACATSPSTRSRGRSAGGELVDPFGGRGGPRGRAAADRRAGRARGRSAAGAAARAPRLRARPRARRRGARGGARAPRRGSPRVAAERVFAELRRVLASERAGRRRCGSRSSSGCCAAVLPELEALRGVEQSRYHHLDVLDHTLAVLDCVVELEREPGAAFGAEHGDAVGALLARPLADELTRGEALRFGALAARRRQAADAHASRPTGGSASSATTSLGARARAGDPRRGCAPPSGCARTSRR